MGTGHGGERGSGGEGEGQRTVKVGGGMGMGIFFLLFREMGSLDLGGDVLGVGCWETGSEGKAGKEDKSDGEKEGKGERLRGSEDHV